MADEVKHSDFVQLIEMCRAGQRAGMYRLHGMFYNYAMTVARRYSGNTEMAEEVVNDAFFKVFTKISQYETGDEGGFKAWLRRIVVNTAIDRFRSNIRAPQIDELQPFHESAADTGLTDRLTFQQIVGMLDQLPPAYRAVFNLHVVEGFTHEEIADTLGISVGASKSNLSRARGRLQQLLSDEIKLYRIA